MRNLISFAKSFSQESGYFLIDLFKRRYSKPLALQEQDYLKKLKTHGYVTIPNFLDKESCDEIIDFLDEEIKNNPKIWKDNKGSDHRIYFSNWENKKIQAFFEDDYVLSILKNYEKSARFTGFTLANKLVAKRDNLGSGGGWHRDYTKRKQTKAILYLSDVDENHGPFQFIEKSHKRRNILKSIVKYGYAHNQNRFEPPEIARQQDGLKTITGKAGSLLLVDTRGLHRGNPISEGKRYALTNYYWFNGQIPSHIEALNPYK